MNLSNKPKAILAWSSGKDSAFALHQIQQSANYEVVALLTTLDERSGRVAMHDVREALLDEQFQRLGLPAIKMRIPRPCPNDIYEARMAKALAPWIEKGVTHIIFGDLFLEDIRAFRETQMQALNLQCVFPLWGKDTGELANRMIQSGMKANVVCVDTDRLSANFAGLPFDNAFLKELPAGIDPCGENGEFHTAVLDSPLFSHPISAVTHPVRSDGRFAYADIEPVECSTSPVR